MRITSWLLISGLIICLGWSGPASALTVETVTTSSSVTGSDKLIRCNAASGAVTITLPAANATVGAFFHFKKVDTSANACTIVRAGSDTLDNGTSVVLTRPFDKVGTIAATATAWDLF